MAFYGVVGGFSYRAEGHIMKPIGCQWLFTNRKSLGKEQYGTILDVRRIYFNIKKTNYLPDNGVLTYKWHL
jgi:hypothetical protein